MYVRRKPLFPKLHKCRWCGKRLSKEDDTIADEIFTGDGVEYDGYYCNKDCARAEYINEEQQRENLAKLNKYIRDETDGE